MSGFDVTLFESHRGRLFGLAYRMLGSAADAEEVVQDTYVRWHGADQSLVSDPAAWLTRVLTNLCRNRLASARARRESYVGPWLPEPVLTGDGTLGPLDTVEQRDSVALGVLVLLERLTPQERAVFVLRAAFSYPYREIADFLGIDEAHARQLQARARRHVTRAPRRFPVDTVQHRRIVERFLAAALSGDLAGLERVLAHDVVSWADGGGSVTAARRPIVGRARVLRYLLGMHRRPEAAHLRYEIAEVNGRPAALVSIGDAFSAVLAPESDGERITAVRIVLNPDKLAFLAHQIGT